MSLETNLKNLITRVATEFKAVRAAQGSLAALSTTDKTSLVAALNELNAALASASNISDATTGAATTWSSQKIQTSIDAAVAALVNGAPGALDTLKELADALTANSGDITTILTALGNRVRVDAAQGLTAPQQQTARDNIGAASAAAIGNTEADFVADFNAALL